MRIQEAQSKEMECDGAHETLEPKGSRLVSPTPHPVPLLYPET